jgi:hypothetical protein
VFLILAIYSFTSSRVEPVGCGQREVYQGLNGKMQIFFCQVIAESKYYVSLHPQKSSMVFVGILSRK